MILSQIDRYIYHWLLEVEIFLVLRQGINPFIFEEYMTVWDFQIFMNSLTKRMEEDKKENSGKNTLMEHLVYLRNLLNTMSLPEKKNSIS